MAETNDEREQLTHYLKSSGRTDCPEWYAQLRIAQTLCCAPWDVFPDDTTSRDVWVKRAVDAMHAEVEAQQYHQRIGRSRRNVWPLDRASLDVDAVARQNDGPPIGKVTTTG